MRTRITFSLSQEEPMTLRSMARKAFRPMKDPIRWILHAEAQCWSLLPQSPAPQETTRETYPYP